MSPQSDTLHSFDHVKAPNWHDGSVLNPPATISGFDTFKELRLSPELSQAIEGVGYVTPTPVQSGCIPLALAGIDLIVQSPTGSGKTASFAIPTLELLEAGKKRVEALVLCPTRELAKQVADEFERLGAPKGISVATVYGGTGFTKQIKDLETAQVVCATPGRLLDLLQRRALSLHHLKVFILDEADEMLNMGFEKDLNAIVEKLPSVRQNLLFSATVTEDIQKLAAHILTSPEFLTFSEDKVSADEVKHTFYSVSGMGRLRDLLKVLEYEAPDNAIIFANTREETFLVTNFLKKHSYNVEVLNGDLAQNEREETLLKLRKGEIDFLVATDVAARGIDISDLGHVFNLTLPDSPEVYVHRTGRTGRAGRSGVAISLISPREIGTYYVLRKVFKIEFEERELPAPEAIAARREERAFRKLLQRLDGQKGLNYGEHLPFADHLLTAEDPRPLIAKLLAYFVAGKEDFAFGAIEPLRPVSQDANPQRLRNGRPVNPRPQRPARPEPAPVAPPEEDDDEAEELEASDAITAEATPEPPAEAPQPDERDERDDEAAPAEGERRGRERRGRGRDRDRDRDRDRGRGRGRRDDREEREERVEAAPVAREVDLADDEEDDDYEAVDGMVKLHLNVGSGRLKDEDSVVQLVCELARITADACGPVTLRRRFSYIHVREEQARAIIDALTGQSVAGIDLKAAFARR